MGVIGTSAGGYATVLSTQGNPMGDAMANVENSAFKYRELKMSKDKAKQDAERDLYDRRRQELLDGQQLADKNPYVAMGNDSDAILKQNYLNFKDAAAYNKDMYQKTGEQKYNVAYDNAVFGAKSLAEMPKAINTIRENLTTNASLFNPVSAKKTLDFINSGLVARLDENNNVVYDQIKKDDNGAIRVIEKGLTPARIKQLTETVPAFNIEEKDGLIEQFSKSVGKEVKVTEGTGLNAKEKTYTPGAKEFAKIMADKAIEERSGMYETLLRMKLDPNDENNYTDEKVKEQASQYLQNILMTTRQEAISDKPDFEATKIKETERQHRENNAIARENLKVSKANSASTIAGREADKNTDRISKTSVVLTKAGKERLAKYKKANPDIKNIDYNLVGFAPGEYETVTTSTAVVKKSNPAAKTKEKVEAKTKTYTATQEKAIADALKKNPGYSRAEIISALKI